MAMRFTVLGSGSGGNASLLQDDDFGVLIDAGLGPRRLAGRLAAVGRSWRQIHAVLLTHTHGDHWRERTFAHLLRWRIPIYCHAQHRPVLAACSTAFAALQVENLVHDYQTGEDLALRSTWRCCPLPLRHDDAATFGFRIDGPADFFGERPSLGYLSDLGSWTAELVQALADVDLLALEFNHELELEYGSGRPWQLIARVVGDHGHLSNDQAAMLLQEIVRLSRPGRLRQVVQLHLSRDCNRPELAAGAARVVLGSQADGIQIHAASQDQPSPTFTLGAFRQPLLRSRIRPLPAPRALAALAACQLWLPGWELENAGTA